MILTNGRSLHVLTLYCSQAVLRSGQRYWFLLSFILPYPFWTAQPRKLAGGKEGEGWQHPEARKLSLQNGGGAEGALPGCTQVCSLLSPCFCLYQSTFS